MFSTAAVLFICTSHIPTISSSLKSYTYIFCNQSELNFKASSNTIFHKSEDTKV
ncbi:MAG: hypothetical protein P1U46_04315 [Patescibacteria group bacterium]|nr:hypothetical protein [Patescibacteria group bacterium]